MVISFAQILQESVQQLLLSGSHKLVSLPPVAIFAMGSTVVIKGIIWFGCIPIKTSQVQALAQDCKTDVFFNTLSLLFPVIGLHLRIWWLDPLGAGLLSLFIIYDWGRTSFENVVRLSGSAVEDRLLQKIIYVAYRFESLVKGIKTVTAYHAGEGVWAEVDVLLPPKEELMKAHDIAETMQYCLEGLIEIDRAFVTVDCELFDFLLAHENAHVSLQIPSWVRRATAQHCHDYTARLPL
jgi:divalent metal cation (Fe/Co/Zn/Cd) transporter